MTSIKAPVRPAIQAPLISLRGGPAGGGAYAASAVIVNSNQGNYFSNTAPSYSNGGSKISIISWFRLSASGLSTTIFDDDIDKFMVWLDGWGNSTNRIRTQWKQWNNAAGWLTTQMLCDAYGTHGIGWDQWICFLYSVDYSIANPVQNLWAVTQANGHVNLNPTWTVSLVGTGPNYVGTGSANGYIDGNGNAAAKADNNDIYLGDFYSDKVFLDFSQESVRDQFIDSNGKPLDGGDNGSDTFGSQPYIYAKGGDFSNNLGSGGNWTANGSIVAAPNSPSD